MQVLRRARGSSDPRFKSIYHAIKAIIFFGTPHHGGNYINIGLTAQKIAAASGFNATDKLLRDLKFDSSIAKMLSEEFTQFLDDRKPIVYTFQEASGLSGFGPLSGKVVDDVSSSLEYPLQFKDHIYANHMDMCRFSGPEDDGFEKVQAAMRHILAGDKQAAREAHGLYQRVLESLFLPDHEERFSQVEQAHKGTFEWLYGDTVNFTQWLRSGNGIFWISGKPASGKSTLLKFAVSDSRTYQYLHQNNSVNRWITGDFFFTNRGKQEQRCVEGLLQRIVFQLLSQAKELLPFIEDLFQWHAGPQGWLLTYLEVALQNIVKQRKIPINICLFIDALDEQTEGYYQNHATLLNYLRELTQHADGNKVRLLLCLTSRPETIFIDFLRGYPGFRIHEHTKGDINLYVNGRITGYINSRLDLSRNPANLSFFQHLCHRICQRAEGVFLWVKLVVVDIIEGLRDGDPPDALRKKLDTIPGNGDLHELYVGILLRLPPNYLHEAYLMLWIAYAANEPMPLGDFFQAKELMLLGDTNYDWRPLEQRQMQLQLLSRCRGFLEIQYSFSKDERGREINGPFVQFLHLSMKDFIRDTDSLKRIQRKLKTRFPTSKALDENGHAYLLRFRVLQHFRRYGNQPEEIANLHSFDLRKFDALYHAYMVEITLERPICEPLDALAQFADNYNLTPCYLRHKGWRVPQTWRPIFLVLCVQAGLQKYVKYALGKGRGMLLHDSRPLLHYAIHPVPETLSQGRADPFLATTKMIRLLIEHGADVEEKFDSLTALAFAFEAFYSRRAQLGSSQHLIIEALLRAGATTDVQTREVLPDEGNSLPQIRRVSLLQMAIHKNDQDTVDLLLKYGTSVNSLDENDWKNLRKGYIYGDECPYVDRYKAQKWWQDRDQCIREGRNKKPMLRLIEKHMRMPRPKISPINFASQMMPSMQPRLVVEPAFGAPQNVGLRKSASAHEIQRSQENDAGWGPPKPSPTDNYYVELPLQQLTRNMSTQSSASDPEAVISRSGKRNYVAPGPPLQPAYTYHADAGRSNQQGRPRSYGPSSPPHSHAADRAMPRSDIRYQQPLPLAIPVHVQHGAPYWQEVPVDLRHTKSQQLALPVRPSAPRPPYPL
ncbi:hypothetical protein DPSP01_014586 [Paraphaeosphaeria sporulosa]